MIDYLYSVEKRLSQLVKSLDGWQRRFVTYETPHVERLYRQDGENRIYLHCILPCTEEQAFYHLHPWPSAMRILDGCYKMQIGVGQENAATMILGPGTAYSMTNPAAMHSVMPYTPTLTVMVTGPVWQQHKISSPVVNSELSDEQAQQLLEQFQLYYP